MTLLQPVKPISILFDLYDVPHGYHLIILQKKEHIFNMAFVPVPNTYTSLISRT